MTTRVEPVNAGLRKMRRSSIGLSLRRSARTKTMPPTTASARATTTCGSVKEEAPPSMTP